MKILHVAAHLGGGVGRVHSSINQVMPAGVEQTYVLLQEPVDRRHVDAIRRRSDVVVTSDAVEIQRLASRADVVQFEFWGHPALADLLKHLSLRPRTRTTCWSHVSGTSPPLVPESLISAVDRLVVTSCVSVPVVGDCVVVNSGFALSDPPPRTGAGICYLGTVDFKKMHRGVFDAVDALKEDTVVSFWGRVGPGVEDAVARMRHPERVRLVGHTDDPAAALSESDVLLYPLRPDHYGTAENALVEAMSMGLVPVVLDNPAELEIVRHGVTGLVARSPAGLAAHLRFLAAAPSAMEILSGNAVKEVSGPKYSPASSAAALAEVWRDLVVGRGGLRKYA